MENVEERSNYQKQNLYLYFYDLFSDILDAKIKI